MSTSVNRRLANSTPDVPIILAKSAIPFIHISSGSIGDNGALSGVTALPTTYSGGAYCYFPANAIAAGVGAGWYWTVFSGTQAGTIYNNTYTSGIPAVPASPTAFSTTGPGAYTGDTTERAGPTITIPGGAMGANGAVIARGKYAHTSTNVKTARIRHSGIAGTAYVSHSVGATTGAEYEATIQNMGSASLQMGYGKGYRSTTFEVDGVQYGTVNTGADSTVVFTHTKGTATDNAIVEGVIVTLLSDGA